MTHLRQQTTIASPVTISGFGFWSGISARLEFRPAPVDAGLVFVRTDIPNQPSIRALVGNRISGPRRTTLSENGVQVEMVEHVLAALAGLQIDNCRIGINAAEVPGLDGSSAPFVETLLKTQIIQQESLRAVKSVLAPIRIEAGGSWIEAKPNALGRFSVNYGLHYPMAPAIGRQQLSLTVTPQTFANELSSARTFLLESEAAQLQQQGLGQRVAYSDVLVFGDNGPIENQLRFSDECVRHKILDIIGDFALGGCDWTGEITAFRTGHELNAQMVSLIEQQNRSFGIRHSA